MTVVIGFSDDLGVCRRVKTRPAAAGVIFGVRREQQFAAARAAIIAFVLRVPILARERALRAFLPQHSILLRGQFLFPLFICLGDFGVHICLGNSIGRVGGNAIQDIHLMAGVV